MYVTADSGLQIFREKAGPKLVNKLKSDPVLSIANVPYVYPQLACKWRMFAEVYTQNNHIRIKGPYDYFVAFFHLCKLC